MPIRGGLAPSRGRRTPAPLRARGRRGGLRGAGGWGGAPGAGARGGPHRSPASDAWVLRPRLAGAQQLPGSLSSGPLSPASRRLCCGFMKLSGLPPPHHLGAAPPHPAPSWLILCKFYAVAAEDWRPPRCGESPRAAKFALKDCLLEESTHPPEMPACVSPLDPRGNSTHPSRLSSKVPSYRKPSVTAMARMGLTGPSGSTRSSDQLAGSALTPSCSDLEHSRDPRMPTVPPGSVLSGFA